MGSSYHKVLPQDQPGDDHHQMVISRATSWTTSSTNGSPVEATETGIESIRFLWRQLAVPGFWVSFWLIWCFFSHGCGDKHPFYQLVNWNRRGKGTWNHQKHSETTKISWRRIMIMIMIMIMMMMMMMRWWWWWWWCFCSTPTARLKFPSWQWKSGYWNTWVHSWWFKIILPAEKSENDVTQK